MSSIARRKSIKAVNLKKLHSDDIGQLKDTRASELGTIVKCHNHACAVTVKREVAQWYNEQNIAITKLSRGQQKVYKSLLKFHQIKKDIKRKAHIKKQIEIQEKLRERASLEKKETELRKTSEKKANDVKKRKELAQKEMRKEKSILRSKYQVLPGIGEEREFENLNAHSNNGHHMLTEKSNTQVTFEDQKDTAIPPTRESLMTTELSDLSGRISAPTYSIQPPNKYNENFPHRYIEPPQNVSRGNSFTVPAPVPPDIYSPDNRHTFRDNIRISTSPTKTPVTKESSFVDVIGKTETLVIKEPTVSDVSLIEAVNKANDIDLLARNDSFARMKMTPPHFSRKPHKLHKKDLERCGMDSGFDSRTSRLSEDFNGFTMTPSPNTMGDLNPHKVLPAITNIKDTSGDNIQIGKTTKLSSSPRHGKHRKKRSEDKLLDDMNKYHVGILNRSFKLPNYKVPQIHHVTKYTKNSQGSLVPSEQTVQPASEEFKLPSNRKAYMRRKALNTERANEPDRERRLQDFFGKMSDMDRDVQVTRTKSKTLLGPQEPFRHHKSDDFSHSNTMRNSVYAYILGTAQGDVTDVKNCRYLRTQADQMGSRRGKVSSWGHQYP